MTVSYRTSSTTTTPSTSPRTTVSTGIVSGDLILLAVSIAANLAAAAITQPAGFTLVASSSIQSSTNSLHIYSKIAGGSEPASYSVSWTGGASGSIGMLSLFSSIGGIVTLDAINTQANSAGVNSSIWPSVTTTRPTDFIAYFGSIGNVTTVGDPLFTVRQNVSGGPRCYIATETYNPIGATGTRTATSASNTSSNTTLAFYDLPASGGWGYVGATLADATLAAVGHPWQGVLYRNVAQHGSTGSATQVITVPTGTVAGDYMVVYLQINSTIFPTDAISQGWVLLRSTLLASTLQQIWGKIAGVSEPASYTFTFASSVVVAGFAVSLWSLTGQGLSVQATAEQNNNVSSLNRDFPSLTTVTANNMLLYFAQPVGNVSAIPPVGTIEIADTDIVFHYYGMMENYAPIGATGTRTATNFSSGTTTVQAMAVEEGGDRFGGVMQTLSDATLAASGAHWTGVLLRGVVATAGANSTSAVFTVPTGTVSGDLMVLQMNTNGGVLPTNAISQGWILLTSTSGAGTTGIAVYIKVASASEPASYTFNWAATVLRSGWVVSLYTTTGNPLAVDTFASQSNSPASTSRPYAVVTPSVANSLLLYGGSNGGTNSGATPDPAQVEVLDADSVFRYYMAVEQWAPASVTTARTATNAGSVQTNVITMAINESGTRYASTQVTLDNATLAATGEAPELQVRGSITRTSFTVTSATIAPYTGVTLGDLMLMQICTDIFATITTPTGWTVVNEFTSGNVAFHIYKRTATASEPATYTINKTGTDHCTVAIIGWYSKSGQAVDVDDSQQSSANNSTRSFPAVTTTKVIAGITAFGTNSGGSASPAAGFNEYWDYDVFIPTYCMAKIVTGAGTYGPFTQNTVSGLWRTITVAVGVVPASPIAATVSVTLDAVVSTATGVLPIVDTLTVTLDDVTLTTTSLVAITGTVNVTLANATSTATAALAIAGSDSTTLDDASLAATGHRVLLGSDSTILDDATLAGTGHHLSLGSVSVTLDDALDTATAHRVYHASIGVTLDDVDTTATGHRVYHASIDVTLDDVDLASTARRIYIMMLHITLDDLILESIGIVAPDAPSDVVADPNGTSEILIAWTDNSSTETAFYIEESANGTTGWVVAGTVLADVTTFTHTGLIPNSLHYYRVRSHNAGGYSLYSNTDSARTDPGDVRVSELAVLVEMESSDVEVTELGVLVEMESSDVEITALSTLVEIGGIGVFLTELSVLIEIELKEEIGMPTYFPRAAGTRAIHRTLPDEVTGYSFDPEGSWWSTIVPEKGRNLLVNPSFELPFADIAAWNSSGFSVTVPDEFGAAGATSGKRCSKSTVYSGTNNWLQYEYPLSIGPGYYTWSVDVYFSRVPALLRMQVINGISTIVTQKPFRFDSSGWRRISMTWMEMGIGDRKLRLLVPADSVATGTYLYTDSWQLEAKAYATTYMDGDMVGFNDLQPNQSFFWEGAPHLSPSVRRANTGAGGRPVAWSEHVGFNTTAIVGLGMGPVDIHTQEMTDGSEIHQGSNAVARDFTITGRIFAENFSVLQERSRDFTKLLRPNNTRGGEQSILRFWQTDSKGSWVGSPLDIVCVYKDGLGGNVTNLYQQAFPVQFHASQPFPQEIIESAASLDLYKKLYSNGIIFKDEDGDYVNLGTGYTDIPVNKVDFDSHGNPVVIGDFAHVAGDIVQDAAYWDGDHWVQLGLSPVGFTYCLDGGWKYGYPIIVGQTNGVYEYDEGTDSWSEIANGLAGITHVVVRDVDGSVYAGGSFNNNGTADNNLLKCVATTRGGGGLWVSLFNGLKHATLTANVKAMVLHDGWLYVGGVFDAVDGDGGPDIPVNNIARWDQENEVWDVMSSGFNGAVTGLAVGEDGFIYATGDFDQDGGGDFDLRGIAKWNGNSWEEPFELVDQSGDFGADGLVVDEKGIMWFYKDQVSSNHKFVVSDTIGVSETFGWKNGIFYPSFVQNSKGLWNLAIGPGNRTIMSIRNATNPVTLSILVPAMNNIECPGDADTPMIVHIKGAIDPIHILNLDTDGGVYFLPTLHIGEQEEMVVRTDTQRSLMYSEGRSNLYRYMSAGPSSSLLLYLRPGINRLSVFGLNADGEDGWLIWKNRYWGIEAASTL